MSRDLINDVTINKKIVLVHKNLMRVGLRNNEFYLCGLIHVCLLYLLRKQINCAHGYLENGLNTTTKTDSCRHVFYDYIFANSQHHIHYQVISKAEGEQQEIQHHK